MTGNRVNSLSFQFYFSSPLFLSQARTQCLLGKKLHKEKHALNSYVNTICVDILSYEYIYTQINKSEYKHACAYTPIPTDTLWGLFYGFRRQL